MPGFFLDFLFYENTDPVWESNPHQLLWFRIIPGSGFIDALSVAAESDGTG